MSTNMPEIDSEIEKIEYTIHDFRKNSQKLFLTSSLQSHSIPLLHIVHQIDPDIPIYFLDTGYHFPETIEFKERLKNKFNLNIYDLESPIEKINQRDPNGKLMYASDPDYCCYMNKVLPLEPVLKEYDVWISGIRAAQNSFRSTMNEIENGKYGTKRYHPVLNWTSKMIYTYQKKHNLPEHPLEAKGYFSVGCMPCTRKMENNGDPREMRWFGMNKTECGLQTDTLDK